MDQYQPSLPVLEAAAKEVVLLARAYGERVGRYIQPRATMGQVLCDALAQLCGQPGQAGRERCALPVDGDTLLITTAIAVEEDRIQQRISTMLVTWKGLNFHDHYIIGQDYEDVSDGAAACYARLRLDGLTINEAIDCTRAAMKVSN